MIQIKGSMMSVREDIKVLDATLRDGGLVNDFYFSDDFVRAIYQMNIAAGVDYMEFGYRADKKQFDVNKFGKWKFAEDDDIRAIVGDNAPGMKISVMADVGRCDYKESIRPKSESPVDLIRIATYINTMPEAVAMIEDAAAKGYETTCNIMAVSKCQERDLHIALDMLSKSPVNAVYVVDSYGALYPIQIRDIVNFYTDGLKESGKLVGIHAHNNQQCAFANTIEAMSVGASMMDGTVMGMGRGAGNCSLEGLLGFLKNPKYDITPILSFIEDHMLKLIEDGAVWGYDIPYLLTGLTDQHPRSAIAAVKENNRHYLDFYNEIWD
ncbi:MAG: aldolase catalytic domain-containing protein [Lachnospiraceae bacterium]|nr:aldolase catalytic domain-containing protein [Lachnospiraceae bacterium]